MTAPPRHWWNRITATIDRWQWLLAPLLVGVYPILFLYNRNAEEVQFNQAVKPLLFVAITTITLGLILRRLFKNAAKVGFSLTIFWIGFFFYGPVTDLADNHLDAGLSRHRYLLPAYLLAMSLLIGLVWRAKRFDPLYLRAALVFGTVLLLTQAIGGTQHQITKARQSSNYSFLAQSTNQTFPVTVAAKPNIYFIMPDSYPRSDTLKDYFGFDNSRFDNFLRSQGFYIVNNSHSNYNQTFFSMPATLNMSYIKDLDSARGRKHDVQIKLYLKNKVSDFLRQGGYRIINNSTIPSTWLNPQADVNSRCKLANSFVDQFSDLTILRPFHLFTREARDNLRAEALCVFDNVSAAIDEPGPKFALSHIYPPHPPYLFDADGENPGETNLNLDGSKRWSAKQPYVAQLEYVNQRLTRIVEAITSRDPSAVIIIQSDHGTFLTAKTANPLNDKQPVTLTERARSYSAIRLPDSCDKRRLYPGMTNVNTFRVIFKACFGADYQLLPDRIYHTSGLRLHGDITKVIEGQDGRLGPNPR